MFLKRLFMYEKINTEARSLAIELLHFTKLWGLEAVMQNMP